MYQKEELFRNEIELEEERKVVVKYHLVTSRSITDFSNESPRGFVYGMEIEMFAVDENGEHYLESEIIEGLCYKKFKITEFISNLARNNVTPMSLINIVDDFTGTHEGCEQTSLSKTINS